MKELWGLVIPFMLFVEGVNIAISKMLPQKYAASVYIGNYAYIVAAIFIGFAMYAFYNYVKNDDD